MKDPAKINSPSQDDLDRSGLPDKACFEEVYRGATYPVLILRSGHVLDANNMALRFFAVDDMNALAGSDVQTLFGRDKTTTSDIGFDDDNDHSAPLILRAGPANSVIELHSRLLATGDTCLELRDIDRYQNAIKSVTNQLEGLAETVGQRTSELVLQIRSHQQTKEKLRMTFAVVDHLTEAVVLMDTDFKTVMANPSFTRITGRAVKEVSGMVPAFLQGLLDDSDTKSSIMKALNGHGIWQSEFWAKRANGDQYAAGVSLSAILNDAGEARQYCAVLTDITQRKKDEEQIVFQANYDPLTALPNRSLFLDRLDQALADMARADDKMALLFLDLDGFKVVNDTLGHDRGDELLQEAANRLVDCARSGDTVARIGGDEFTIIMPHLKSPENASIIAGRVLEQLTQPFFLNEQEAFVSASIGITIFPDDAIEASELLKNADAAMYQAKDQGKNNFQFFTTDLNEQVMERLILKTGLVNAILRKELSLHYQPKVDIKTGKVTSVEALMRWNSVELGFVSPARFIPILEETGMVVDVGLWALRVACEQYKNWLQAGLPSVPIAVNLSVRQLREPDFVDKLQHIFEETGTGPEGIEIEITESMLMSDAKVVIVALQKLHDIGIKIAMDDFGTGYSSLSYLKRFPIDIIKIDQSFVNDIATDSDDAEIIKAIIKMGQTLNRKIVAEGVETAEQLAILSDYRCDEMQGYYFAKPMAADDATPFLKDHFSKES